MNLINFAWILVFLFNLVCINILYPTMRHYISNLSSGSVSVYHIIARKTLISHQMTGTIFCISAITSRFDFASDYLSSNFVVIVSVCTVYEFAFITANISLGCLAIIRLLCLVNISWIEESIGELLTSLIHLAISIIIGIGIIILL